MTSNMMNLQEEFLDEASINQLIADIKTLKKEK